MVPKAKAKKKAGVKTQSIKGQPLRVVVESGSQYSLLKLVLGGDEYPAIPLEARRGGLLVLTLPEAFSEDALAAGELGTGVCSWA